MSKEKNSSNVGLTKGRNLHLTTEVSDMAKRGLDLLYEMRKAPSKGIPVANPGILIVDDEKDILTSCSQYLRNKGYVTYTALDSFEAIEILSENSVDIVVTGINQPGMSGLELTKFIKEKYDVDVIIMTGWKEFCSHKDASEHGAIKLFYKPVKLVELLESIQKGLKDRHLRQRNSMYKS